MQLSQTTPVLIIVPHTKYGANWLNWFTIQSLARYSFLTEIDFMLNRELNQDPLTILYISKYGVPKHTNWLPHWNSFLRGICREKSFILQNTVRKCRNMQQQRRIVYRRKNFFSSPIDITVSQTIHSTRTVLMVCAYRRGIKLEKYIVLIGGMCTPHEIFF